jgi:predicted metal-binding protein
MHSIRCILLLLFTTSRCCIMITALTVISVCQNKDCCQRFTLKSATLGQTLDHLLHHGQRPQHEEVQVKATGCLGHCGQGPNIQIDGANHRHRIVSRLDTTEAAAVALKGLDFVVHPTLLAATNVMERSSRGTLRLFRCPEHYQFMLLRLAILESPRRILYIPFLHWCYLEPTLTLREVARWSISC